MLIAFLAGLATAAAFAVILGLAGLIADRGAAAMSIIAVASLYPVFAIGSGFSDFLLHLAILGGFMAAAVAGYLFAPRLIALVILGHALLDLSVALAVGTNTPSWVGFCAGFDVLLGAVFMRTLAPRA